MKPENSYEAFKEMRKVIDKEVPKVAEVKHFESIYEFSLDKIEEDLRLLEAIKKRISIQAIERTPEYIKLNFNVEAVKMIDTEDGVWVRNKSNEEETDLLFKFADEMRMAKPLD